MTGLTRGQLTDLVARAYPECGDKFVSRGRPMAVGLFRSVAMVVCLLRKNPTQEFVGAVFGVSQSTVSRRWDLLRPVIATVLAEAVPTPQEIAGRGTVLVDGTVCPTWDWRGVPDLYSAKAGYPGMNLQVAATLDGTLVAVGPVPVPGTTPTLTPRAGWPRFWARSSRWPTWAMSVSRGSTRSRTSGSPASTSMPARSSSTPR
jgi:hypothetical protein